MGPGVHGAEADDRPLGLRARDAHARRPVRLEGQAHRARGDGIDHLVEQGLGFQAELRGPGHLVRPELALEPLDHPEAAVDLDLERVGTRHGGRIRRHERDRLDVPAMGRVDRRGRAVRDGPDVRLEGARAEDLAGLVRGGRDDRRARRRRRDARRQQRSGRRAVRLGGTSSGSWLGVDRDRPPLPVGRGRPSAGPCSRTGRSRPGAAVASTKRPVSRWLRKPDRKRKWRRLPPDVGLVGADPVRLRIGLEGGDGIADAEGTEAPGR